MVALVHSEALGCVRPSVLSRDRNSFCLCCSASPVPSPGSSDRSCTGPHSPCGTQSHPKKGVLVKLVKKGHLVLVKCLFSCSSSPLFPAHLQPTSLSQSYNHICLVPTHCPVPAPHRSLQTSSKPGLLWHQQLLTGASHLPGPSPAPLGLPRIPSAPWAKQEAVSGSSSFSSSPTPPGCPVQGAAIAHLAQETLDVLSALLCSLPSSLQPASPVRYQILTSPFQFNADPFLSLLCALLSHISPCHIPRDPSTALRAGAWHPRPPEALATPAVLRVPAGLFALR